MSGYRGRTRSTSPSPTEVKSPKSVAAEYIEENGGDLAATEAVAIRLAILTSKARGVAWKDMTISEQIASLASGNKNIMATMSYSWCHGGIDLDEVMMSQSEDDLRVIAFTLGLPLPSNVKKLTAKNLNGLRTSIADRVREEWKERPNVSGVDEAGDRLQDLRILPPERPPSPEISHDSSSSSSVKHLKNAINLAFQIPPVNEKLPSLVPTEKYISASQIPSSSRFGSVNRPSNSTVSDPTQSIQGSVEPSRNVIVNNISNIPPSNNLKASLYEQGEPYQSEESDEGEPDEDSSPAYRGGRMTSGELNHELMRSGIGLNFASEWIQNAHKVSGIQGPSPINDLYRLQKIPDYQQRKLPYMNAHAKEEILTLTRIIDALVRRDVNEALEHATRRIGGLETAILTNNWEVCKKLTTSYEQQNFVPRIFLASALKSVHREQAIRKAASSYWSSTKPSDSDLSYRYTGSRSRRNRDETYSSHRNQNSESKNASTRGTSRNRTPSTSGSRTTSGRDPSRQ